VPKDVYNFGVNLKQDNFWADVLLQYVTDQFYEEDNTDTIDNRFGGYDPHASLDVTVGYKFLKNCSLSASVLNVSDEQYWEGTDKNPGRTYMVKATASF